MNTNLRLLGRAAVLFALLQTGCVSSKYKLASKNTLPPVMLNLAAAQPPIEAVVHSVIVYQGPGSWKKEAYWDEYVLSLANRGPNPLTLEDATLMNFQEIASSPGVDPWTLESESKTWWQKTMSSQTGSLVALGAGGYAVAHGLAVAAVNSGLWGTTLATWGTSTATGTALAGAAFVALAATPVYAVSVVVINSKNKKQVLTEFSRRRLVLPVTIAPGQTAQGSLFFRISPGPQRLALRGRAGDEPVEAVIDLAPLKGLHLKAPPTAPQPPAETIVSSAPSR